MVSSSAACIVYNNGSAWGNCATNRVLVNYFALPQWWYQLFYGMIAGCVVLGALYIMTKYRERPYGRFLEGWNGLVGIGRAASGMNAIGKITTYVDSKLALFDPGPGKGRLKRLITMMPDSVIPMTQKDGGVSFSFVDLDKRTSMDTHLLQWAEKRLANLAKKGDFGRFVFEWKLKQLEMLRDLKPRFPPIKESMRAVTLESGKKGTVPVYTPATVSILVGNPGEWQTKQVVELLPEEREWYDKTSTEEGDYIRNFRERGPELKAKLEAALSGSKHYHFGGQKVELSALEKTSLQRTLTEELAVAQGPIADAIFGGSTIPVQHVAGVLAGLPNAAYIKAILEDLEKKLRMEIKDTWKNYLPLVIIFAMVVGMIVLFGFVIK